ncbi:MAG: response regulator transcription factor [Dehalococcoidia bacterium]|nr:response regulator transcription factor [Dehalococcoidia bacterium]
MSIVSELDKNFRVEASGLVRKEVEQLVNQRAREKARSARWDLNVAVLAYAILAAIVLLRFEGIAIEIVAPIALFGFGMIWLIGWRRGKQLYKLFCNEELDQLQELLRERKAEASISSPLTPRELEILSHIARGYINKQIADKLGISEQTIKNHMSSVLRKLDANDRTQAVVLAMHYGWIPLEVKEPLEQAAPRAFEQTV